MENNELLYYWTYNDEPFTYHHNYHSFVYIISCTDDPYYYIGKKNFFFKKPIHRSGKIIFRHEESDWNDYWGSSKPFQEFVNFKGLENFERTILHLCKTSKVSQYFENYELFKRNALYDSNCFNDNINGKWFFDAGICEHFQKQNGNV